MARYVIVEETPAATVVVKNYSVITELEDTKVVITHRGPVGPQGEQGIPGECATVFFDVIAGMTLSGHRIVVPQPDLTVVYADNDNMSHIRLPMWLTLGAATAGQPVTVHALGTVVEPGWSWTPGEPIYLGDDGIPTQTTPDISTATFLIEVALAESDTVIFYNPKIPIVMA